jgi:hypothetical protein
MGIDQLIFVGLNRYALALDRNTGAIVWFNDQMKRGAAQQAAAASVAH